MNLHCNKCDKELHKEAGFYWDVKQHKTIIQYGIEAPNYEQVGHWCDACWKDVENQYKKNPVVKKYKYTGNYHKYLIEKHEYSKVGGVEGTLRWQMWWHEDTQEWKTTKPANDNDGEREREQKWNQLCFMNRFGNIRSDYYWTNCLSVN